MRTNVEIDEKIIKKALHYNGLKTKKPSGPVKFEKKG